MFAILIAKLAIALAVQVLINAKIAKVDIYYLQIHAIYPFVVLPTVQIAKLIMFVKLVILAILYLLMSAMLIAILEIVLVV